MSSGAYFYGAPGVFASDDDSSAFPFTPEQLEQAAKLLEAASIASTRENQPNGKPSWASVAATKPHPGAAIIDIPENDNKDKRGLIEHDTRANCVFYLNGSCRYGDGCRFKHAKPETSAVEFFLECMSIERSKDIVVGATPPETSTLLAGLRESSEELPSSLPAASIKESEADRAFAAESDAWQAESIAHKNRLLQRAVDRGLVSGIVDAETALQVAERVLSADVVCGICLEHIVEARGGRFGLLTGCCHAFCLECIRQWRARVDLPKETVRACPVCRTISYFVIPCDRYITDPARKAAVNAEYSSSQKTIPCRYYDYGRGACPFGSSCRYAHLNPDGTEATASKAVYRLNSEGEVASAKQYKLSEFL